MRSAIQSFVGVTVLILVFGFAGWVFLRHGGMLQARPPVLDHPFLRGHSSNIVAYHVRPLVGGEPYSRENLEALQAARGADLILWIEVRQRRDGTFVAADSEDENVPAPRLKDVFAETAERRIVLNFRGNREGSREGLAKIIQEAKAGDRVLVQSPEDGFLKDLRELQPLWLYGTSLAQVTRMIMLSSLGLASLAPIKGDVLVVEADAKEHLLGRLSDAVIAEAHRRGMKVFAGPVPEAEMAAIQKRGVDGILARDL